MLLDELKGLLEKALSLHSEGLPEELLMNLRRPSLRGVVKPVADMEPGELAGELFVWINPAISLLD